MILFLATAFFFFVCGGAGVTFEGIISTAGDGSCRSFSDIIGTQLVALLGSKPGKHWTSSDGAFIALQHYLLISDVNKAERGETILSFVFKQKTE